VIRALRLLRPAWWMLVVALATAWVWQRYAVVRLGEEIEQAQSRITELTRVRDRLLAENATLSARSRIAAIAAARGLQPIRPSQRRLLVMTDTARAVSPNSATVAALEP
jgi:cell division protein FtsL